jgi:HIRAN domain
MRLSFSIGRLGYLFFAVFLLLSNKLAGLMDPDNILFAIFVITGVIIALAMIRRSSSPSAETSAPKAHPRLVQATDIKAAERAEQAFAEQVVQREEQFIAGILARQTLPIERWFHTTIAGTKHRNPDGTSRTAGIKLLERDEELSMEHELDNEYDKYAVAVHSTYGQIGYLPSRLAGETVRAESRAGHVHALYFSHENLHPESGRVVGATCIYIRLTPGASEST